MVLPRSAGLAMAVSVLAIALLQPLSSRSSSAYATAVMQQSPAAGTFRGSNNWLSFCGNVNETKLLSSAMGQAEQLLPFNYTIYGLDAGWSFCASGDCSSVSPNHSNPQCCGVGHGMDEYGRALPNPAKYPSSGPAGTLGFKSIIEKVHSLGLKFQLRMERGIPIEAVQQKTKVFGTGYTADQIVDWNRSCGQFGVSGGWGGVFVGINASHPGGRAYVQSVVDLWVEWGVDAIEADDYMGGTPEPNQHTHDCCAYPYYSEINLLADAIRNSKKPEMVLSIMPGDGAVPEGGAAVAATHGATAYRITPDFHADTGGAGGVCRNPAGCWGAPGSEIVLANCSETDKAQVWEWRVVGSAHTFAMTFSAGPMLLSCRHDATHDCLAGDDLDLWGTSDTLNQLLNVTRAPTTDKPGALQFLQQPGTCVSSKGGLLRMAECAQADATQQWKLVPNMLSQGSISLQSLADPSMCIMGEGKSAQNQAGNANWPPAVQFSQAATFAHLQGRNGTYFNLDDLPMGHMTLSGCNPNTLGPCVWSEPQQRSVFTLYCMSRSPIMFSGDMPTDDSTLKIVTNSEVLAIQESSTNGREVSNVAHCNATAASYKCSEVIWAADDGSGGEYVAAFWTGTGSRTVHIPLAQIRSSGAHVRDLWKLQDLEPVAAGGSLVAHLLAGDVALFRLSHSA